MTGKQLQRLIIEEAQRAGWSVAHFPPVQTMNGWRVPVGADGKGWPDMMLVRDRLIAAEVKGAGDSLRPEQEQWLTRLRIASVETYVWTPEGWAAGSIQDVLHDRPAARPHVQTTLASLAGGGTK